MFSENRAVYEIMWTIWYRRAGHKWHNTSHKLCMLEKWGYRHILRICNIYCFFTKTI